MKVSDHSHEIGCAGILCCVNERHKFRGGSGGTEERPSPSGPAADIVERVNIMEDAREP